MIQLKFLLVWVIVGLVTTLTFTQALTGAEQEERIRQLIIEELRAEENVFNSSLGCRLVAMDKNVHQKVMDAVTNGMRLITFTLNFPDYQANPLLTNMSNTFRGNIWHRTFDLHGYTLLSFPFNYKVLSLTTLSHGTMDMTVDVVDHPKGCLESLDVKYKLAAAAFATAEDFNEKKTQVQMFGSHPHTCHEFVKNDTGFGVFEFRCCRLGDDGGLECNEHRPALWVKELYKYIAALQVVAFLTGPLFLGGIFLTMSLRKRGYEVKLDEPIKGTISVDNTNAGSFSPGEGWKKSKSIIKRPQLLEKQLQQSQGAGKRQIAIKRLLLLVDESSLITESTVPVGLFKFIYNDIFLCGIGKWEPFTSCFKASIFGPFNCLGLKYLSLGAVMTFMGLILGFLLLPFPFYIRIAAYYGFEDAEITARLGLLSDLGLDRKYEHNLLFYLSPSHPFFVVVYAVYALAIPTLLLLRMFNPTLFSRVTTDAFRDLREIFRMEAIRLFFTYLFLPFEKWGLLGLFVGILYWPFAIPIFLVIALIYFVPTLYMTGRFLILRRPSFFTKECCACPSSEAVRNLRDSRFPRYQSQVESIHSSSSRTINTLEDSLLLNNISRKMQEDNWEESEWSSCLGLVWMVILRLCMGLTCIALMYSVLAMFSEAVGFFVEVIIFTIMGAIVNANSSAKFIAVAFMLIAYCTSCFNSMYSKYVLLNEMIFKQLKDKLHEKIRSVTKQRLDFQVSSAFKYLTLEEEKEMQKSYVENMRLKTGDPTMVIDVSSIYDHLESIDGKLHWKVNSLVMFVDRRDSPRIPKELFFRISDSEGVPDNPGSIPVNMIATFKQLLYMVIFLSFVVLVVITFHQVYLMSTTNQLLLTLGGGIVPLLIKSFMTPAATTKSYSDKGFINYAFEGCVNEIVEDFQQSWPVFDIDFDYIDDANDDDGANDDEAHDVGGGGNAEKNPDSVRSFRPPEIHLKFNYSQTSPRYDEPFDPENMPLNPASEKMADAGKSLIKPGLEAHRAQDTSIFLDFCDGKCRMRDIHYI